MFFLPTFHAKSPKPIFGDFNGFPPDSRWRATHFDRFSVIFNQFQSASVSLINFNQFQSVWLGQKRRNLFGGWQRVGAQKGGFENALFNLKSPWTIPENTLIFESRNFQAFFMAPLPRKMHENAWKILENAWKTLDSKIRVFSNPPFYAPTLCHPLIYSQPEGGENNT